MAAKLLDELHCRGLDPDVIIIETFRRVLVGGENEADRVAEFWRQVEPLQRAGKTVIISHHMKKPSNFGSQVRYQASGSTDIIGELNQVCRDERQEARQRNRN